MITNVKPHYLLFCEGHTGPGFGFSEDACRWRFVLENVESGHRIEVWDYEEILHPDRISLMAVIRGLEALEQPSKVTLVTTNRYVARGLQYGLTEWRESDFCWEHFGSIQPIRNQDLWRRVDTALKYHEVTCRWMAYDTQEDRVEGDRRDVPIETLEYRETSAREDGEIVSDAPRVRSRSFSAMVRSAPKPEKTVAQGHDPNRSGKTVGPCMATKAESNSTASVETSPKRSSASETKSGSALRLPGAWIWRFVLRTDTMLGTAVRSMLMLDPKPESYRIRR